MENRNLKIDLVDSELKINLDELSREQGVTMQESCIFG